MVMLPSHNFTRITDKLECCARLPSQAKQVSERCMIFGALKLHNRSKGGCHPDGTTAVRCGKPFYREGVEYYCTCNTNFIYLQQRHGTLLLHQRTRSFIFFRTCKSSTPLRREVPSGK